jgi:nucleoside-diphosphate-sugar epimerase
MRVLITGGGGFVGSSLAHLLHQYGHTTLAPKHQELDMLDASAYSLYLNRHCPDAVIHTAFKGLFGVASNDSSFLDNLKMYETLWLHDSDRPTIIFGSGAEFDRRLEIDNVSENEMFRQWPIDYYGLSKNLITRRFLTEIENPYLLRLFGCFGSDEQDTRFIKRSITRLKQGLPIEIERDKLMDFFYIEDVAAIVHQVLTLQSDSLTHMNLTYDKKLTLSQVGATICSLMGVPENVIVKNPEMDLPYTGDNTVLKMHNFELFGLENGIRRMIHDLK